MERDSLLAHGVSFLLQDRLMNCSDYTQCSICKECGCILSPMHVSTLDQKTVECILCKKSTCIVKVAVPYVFRYLCTELVAMNVKLKLTVE